MPIQTVPNIDFGYFTVASVKEHFLKERIRINYEYQRGDIWRNNQQIELINSINSRYSIGVLVLFVNDGGEFEILDGQQRLLTIKKYLNGELDVSNTEIEYYDKLGTQERSLLDAYCVYYLKLKSHDPETKEEDIVQTFLRLQEGTPLNKAEKINAFRGAFKDAFRDIRDNHKFFDYLGTEKRFRFRQLAAELLLIELESDFENLVFPGLDQKTLISAIRKYEKQVSKKTVQFIKGNLDFMEQSLNYLLTGLKLREIIGFYLLISYLRKKKAGNENLKNELMEFAKVFLQKLNSFSMYDLKPPTGMSRSDFDSYKLYKQEAKAQTTASSIKARLEILIKEFNKLKPIIIKDVKRLHDTEQKRILYFRQKGECGKCGKPLDFRASSAHHVIAHKDGGKTDDLNNGKLMHERCHVNLEASLRKGANQPELFTSQ